MAMVKELEDGLQAHREQQEKLVQLWLDQHEVMRSELQVRFACFGRRLYVTRGALCMRAVAGRGEAQGGRRL